MKKLLLLFFAVLLSLPAFAYDYQIDGIFYDLDTSNHTATVTSNKAYTGNIIIPSSITYNDDEYAVTSIGDHAFSGCTGLTSVEIGSSVTSIGNYAFYRCSGLKNVTFADGKQTIYLGYNSYLDTNVHQTLYEGLFADCPLETLYLGRNLNYSSSSSAGYSPFYNKTTLESVEIGKYVTTINEYIFYGCSSLNDIDIPASVTAIGERAFYGCRNMKSVLILPSVRLIGSYAFAGCSGLIKSAYPNTLSNPFSNDNAICYPAESSIIENGLIYSLDKSTLYYVPLNLTNFVIPNTIKSIGDYAFYGCSALTSIIIPPSVTSIGTSAFSDCNGLIKSAYPNSISNPFSSGIAISYPAEGSFIEDGWVYGADKSAIYFAPFDITDIEIPGSVTSIGSDAFSGCTAIKNVTFADGEETLSLSNGLFADCPLETLYLGRNLRYSSSSSAGYSPFYNKTKLKSVEIGKFVSSIGQYAFQNCSALTRIFIPPSVTSIGSDAFSGCTAIKNVSFADGEETLSLSNGLFADCPLETLYLGRNLRYSSSSSSGYSPFYNKTKLKSVEIGNSVTSIGNYAFQNCSTLTSIVIPPSVTSLGDYAFNSCAALKNVTFADGEKTLSLGYNSLNSNGVGKGLFYDCPLETLYLGRNLSYSTSSSAGYSPFYNKTTLKSVEIGNAVTKIGNYAFYGCNALETINSHAVTPPTIYENTFESYTAALTIPYGSWMYYSNSDWRKFNNISYENGEGMNDGVFSYRYLEQTGEAIVVPDDSYKNMTSASIPDQVVLKNGNDNISYRVVGIDPEAFKDCTKLTQVILPAKCEFIGESAFSGCSGLIKSAYPNTIQNPFPKGIAISYPAEGSIIEKEVIYSADKSVIYFAPLDITHIEIPGSVTEIGDYAFYGCNALETINSHAVTPPTIYENTFQSYTAALTIPNGSWIYYSNSDWRKFNNISYENGEKIEGINDGVFSYRYSENPGEVMVIKDDSYKNMTSASIPDQVVVKNGNDNISYRVVGIDPEAFKDCTKLTQVILPTKCEFIGESAFSGCFGLIKSAYPNTIQNPFPRGIAISYPAEGSIIEKEVIYRADKSVIYFAPLDITDIEIPGSVTSIGNSAFRSCTGLTTISIPASVTSIGNSAFYYCTGLTSIEIGSSVTEIGSNAFSDCSGLTSVEIPGSVTSIGDYAFYYCRGLKSVVIPGSVTAIGSDAFIGCSGLTKVEISDIAAWCGISFGNSSANPLRYAGHLYLEGSEVTDLVIPNSVTKISASAFYYCSGLTSVEIPGSVTSIGNSAFSGCSGLKSVEIPGSVTSIGNSAFYGCSALTSVEIGNAVTSIGNYAFYYCSGLTSVEIPGSVTSIGDYAFSGCRGLTNVVIGKSVTSIGASAFKDCSRLTGIEIPASVTSIGDNAFFGCNGLTRVDISDIAAWCGISFGENFESSPLFYARRLYLDGSEVTDLVIPNSVKSIGNNVFSSCNSLTSVIIGNSVKSIGNSAFNSCIEMKKLEIGNSVTSIGILAFAGCTGLTSIEIPGSVTEIGASAFYYCSGLTDFTFADGIEPLTIGINNSDFNNVKTLYLGREISSPKSRFRNITDLTYGGFVSSIPENTWNGIKSLASLTINNGIMSEIGAGAFQGCSALASVTFPENAIEIGDNAFSGTALAEVTVPAGTIGANAFASNNLKDITLGAGVETVGNKAFDGSNSISNVYSTRTTPPQAQDDTFSYYESPLWVPEEAVDTYCNTYPCWHRFNARSMVMPEQLTVDGDKYYDCEPGTTIQLTATLEPANVTLDRILWRSSNPALASVDNNGLVTIHKMENLPASRLRGLEVDNPFRCEITASTLYDDSPVAMVVIDSQTSRIEYINADKGHGLDEADRPNDIYTLQGVLLKRNASQKDIDALVPGFYIIGGRKMHVK